MAQLSHYQDFLERYPAYAGTARLDDLRRSDYSRLDALGQVYLDYTGGSLYAESQLKKHHELLSQNVFGNPHSHNPTSLAMTELVERARRFVLEFFNAPADEYVAIFTPNASGALKLVGESYPFAPGGQYVLAFDNHNSVNGIREFARSRGAQVTYVPVVAPELHLDHFALQEALNQQSAISLEKSKASNQQSIQRLFAYPAQSNFSGVQHSLEWIDYAHQRGWDVLLDCAAFAPTNRLDIGHWRPDFAAFSFYKIFGYPTGLGCLLVRREKLDILRRPWFAGGTITIASVQGNGYYLQDGEAAFEDGTVDYLNIPAVEIGLRHIQEVGVELIHERVTCLAGWLIDELSALRHSNGRPMVHLHGPATTEGRGATVTISLYDINGETLDDHRIEELANYEKISLRTGCFCNPGAGEIAHGLSGQEMSTFFEDAKDPKGFEKSLGSSLHKVSFLELRQLMQERFHKSVSSVRISLGIASNFADVEALMRFLEGFRDCTWAEVGLATYDQVSAHHLHYTTKS